MRYRDAKPGRKVVAKMAFKIIGEMSFSDKNSVGELIRKGTKGVITGTPIRVRNNHYIPVVIGRRKSDVLAKYLDLA